MTDNEILAHIDHTLLTATVTRDEITSVCHEAVEFNTASVCIPPSYVGFAREWFPSLNICTVVGFPLGYAQTEAKCLETAVALKDGANEIDMVISLTDVKNGDFSAIQSEIKSLKTLCGSRILKVIIETCYLDEYEKIKLCEIVTNAGADYIKTSTGFGTAGAAIEDIRLFKQHIGENVKIKAAGGIRTREQMEMFLSEGCDRIGSSAAVKLFSAGK